jgi:WD40 repeat protein
MILCERETGHVLHFAPYEEQFWRITWSPDGRRLAALAQDGTIAVWKAEGEPCVPK